MPTTRRQFIKQSVGAVTASMLIPKFGFTQANGQSIDPAANLAHKLVVIQFSGGNDGLSNIIPYSDSRYYQLRPDISLQPSELKDDTGATTMINNDLALHPRLKEIKQLYDAGKVALIVGVDESDKQSLSHFEGTTNLAAGGLSGTIPNGGWLGRYASQAFAGQPGFYAAGIGSLPQMFYTPDTSYVIPSISSFAQYTFQTDARNTRDRNNQITAFTAGNSRSFDSGGFIDTVARAGAKGFTDSITIQTETAKYAPQGYPNTGLANLLKMVAQLIVTIPTSALFHVSIGGFDFHQNLVANVNGQVNKLVNGQAGLLMQFSQAVKAFYDDLDAHGLSQNTLIMTYSEFGRRPQQNGTMGCDHGRASAWYVIGGSVKGGVYGQQPSLSSLDRNGNLVGNVDLRSIYATVLDKWLNHDSRSVLGASFDNVGFLN